MTDKIRLDHGAQVAHAGKTWTIVRPLDFDRIILQDLTGRERVIAAIAELKPAALSSAAQQSPALFDVPPAAWDEADSRYEFIRPLLDKPGYTKADVVARGAEIGRSSRTLYRYIRIFNQTGQLSSLLPRYADRGGKGKSRLHPEVDEIIREVSEKFYLARPPRTKKDTAQEVIRRCKAREFPAPHKNTVIRRLSTLPRQLVVGRRLGRKAARPFEAHPGHFNRAQHPLALVQIDHTKLDVIVLDEEYRQPIGRPWITLVQDVFSRMVLGFHVSLDPTGALSTGLALTHAILRKDAWLKAHGIEKEWPCWGLMDCIHADNALEFHGNMLQRACKEYMITLAFRRPGEPHFGGHIERLLGTMLRELHKHAGTTFSNTHEKGSYDSEGHACLTLSGLNRLLGRWFVEFYHRAQHRGIGMAPIEKWKEGFFGETGRPFPITVTDEQKLKLDFMPFTERSVQPTGVEFEGFHYFDDVLRPWVGERQPGSAKARKFVFAFDPRDIRELFFFDPDKKEYHPLRMDKEFTWPISIWDARKAGKRLTAEDRKRDESARYETIYAMRQEVEQQAKESKRVRREKQRMVDHVRSRRYVTRATAAAQLASQEKYTPQDIIDDGPVPAFPVEKA